MHTPGCSVEKGLTDRCERDVAGLSKQSMQCDEQGEAKNGQREKTGGQDHGAAPHIRPQAQGLTAPHHDKFNLSKESKLIVQCLNHCSRN